MLVPTSCREPLMMAVSPSDDSLDGATAPSSDGSTAIVGRWSDDVSANTDQGSAQVFVQDGGNWTQRGAALTASDGQAEDLFGWSVALSSDGLTAIVGGPGADVGGHADQGSARVLAWDGGEWTQRGDALTFGEGGSADHLGSSVALSSDGLTATVGAGGDTAPLVLHWDGFHWL